MDPEGIVTHHSACVGWVLSFRFVYGLETFHQLPGLVQKLNAFLWLPDAVSLSISSKACASAVPSSFLILVPPFSSS